MFHYEQTGFNHKTKLKKHFINFSVKGIHLPAAGRVIYTIHFRASGDDNARRPRSSLPVPVAPSRLTVLAVPL